MDNFMKRYQDRPFSKPVRVPNMDEGWKVQVMADEMMDQELQRRIILSDILARSHHGIPMRLEQP